MVDLKTDPAEKAWVLAQRQAALQRVHEDFEIMLYEADIILGRLASEIYDSRTTHPAYFHLMGHWLKYKTDLIHNINACHDWEKYVDSTLKTK